MIALERILVVMPNWFGEALFATPFLRALHQQHPQASITVMGVARAQLALERNPHIQRFLLYEERGAHRMLGAKREMVKALRAGGFEAAFVLRRSLSRTALLALAGIPRRVGFANWKSGWLLTHRRPALRTSLHKAATYLHLLASDGHLKPPGPCEYYPSDSERQQALAVLRAHGLPDEHKPLVVLHPGANWPHKRWPARQFAQLANQLTNKHPLSIVITGAPEDASLAQELTRHLATPAVVLVGRTDFRLAAACLEHARLVISNDTGMLHVATALGRPVVALYGPTSPAITGPLSDPARTIVIHHPDCCPAIPCFNPQHPNFPGMEAIAVEEVEEAALQVLTHTPPPVTPATSIHT